MAPPPTVAIIQGDRSIASPLETSDTGISDSVKAIVTKASTKWLENEDVVLLLENFQNDDGIIWPKKAAESPEGGKLFVFNRKHCPTFRGDKHDWMKRPGTKKAYESHAKLKVKDRDCLTCYYIRTAGDSGLQRRCYWLLKDSKKNIVLVHYLYSDTCLVDDILTTAECALLVNAVEYVGSGTWADVKNRLNDQSQLEERTQATIYNTWLKLVEKATTTDLVTVQADLDAGRLNGAEAEEVAVLLRVKKLLAAACFVPGTVSSPWTTVEYALLVDAVECVGSGTWAEVKNRLDDQSQLEERTQASISDKWRQLVEKATTTDLVTVQADLDAGRLNGAEAEEVAVLLRVKDLLAADCFVPGTGSSPWTTVECALLVDAVECVGSGTWAEVKNRLDDQSQLEERTQASISDKWRRLVEKATTTDLVTAQADLDAGRLNGAEAEEVAVLLRVKQLLADGCFVPKKRGKGGKGVVFCRLDTVRNAYVCICGSDAVFPLSTAYLAGQDSAGFATWFIDHCGCSVITKTVDNNNGVDVAVHIDGSSTAIDEALVLNEEPLATIEEMTEFLEAVEIKDLKERTTKLHELNLKAYKRQNPAHVSDHAS